jgi:hypothetical protein
MTPRRSISKFEIKKHVRPISVQARSYKGSQMIERSALPLTGRNLNYS